MMETMSAKNERLQTVSIVWNLADLYRDLEDPALARDIQTCEDEAAAISREHSGMMATLDAARLAALVARLEETEVLLGRLAAFAYLQFATSTRNQQISAFLQRIREIGSRISRETVFFELEWNTLDQERVEQLLDSEGLAHYRHYLANMRRYAPHQLSQVEERLLLEKAPVGWGSWTTLFEKVMGHLKFGDQGRSEEEVLADLYSGDRQIRRRAAEELTTGLAGQLHVLTHIFNTLLADKMITDRLRHYISWISSMNLGNELRDETVAILVDTVSSRYDIPQRYYRVKRKLLGLDELFDYDRYAPLPHLPSRDIPWGRCREMVLAAFAEFSPEMAEIAARFFTEQWIHAPLLEGKRGGAFAHPCVPAVHPYVMVNYTGNLRDVSTVAHELGHGVHQYLAAEQGYYNANTPLVLAETASVFGELLVFNFQLELITEPDERRAFICQKLESIFATVFRQISMNRFENMVHTARRETGELASETISEYWLATQHQMFDDSVTLTGNYGNWWSYIPHFLSAPGYVYSYAFGELLVLALYNLYQREGHAFVPKYLALLKAGGSLSPYELLGGFGVAPDDPDFWAGGLRIIDDMLSQVE
jgi:oligoendopeptidase F